MPKTLAESEAEGRSVLTSEGVSLSVLTRRQRRRADKRSPKGAACWHAEAKPERAYAFSRYPVLKIHHTAVRQRSKKTSVMVRLRPTLTSAKP